MKVTVEGMTPIEMMETIASDEFDINAAKYVVLEIVSDLEKKSYDVKLRKAIYKEFDYYDEPINYINKCRMILSALGNNYATYRCSECEQETTVLRVIEGMSRDYKPPKYCSNCGRKVV